MVCSDYLGVFCTLLFCVAQKAPGYPQLPEQAEGSRDSWLLHKAKIMNANSNFPASKKWNFRLSDIQV